MDRAGSSLQMMELGWSPGHLYEFLIKERRARYPDGRALGEAWATGEDPIGLRSWHVCTKDTAYEEFKVSLKGAGLGEGPSSFEHVC